MSEKIADLEERLEELSGLVIGVRKFLEYNPSESMRKYLKEIISEMKEIKYEIKQNIIQSVLLDKNVINIKALERSTGHRRNTLLKHLPECRSEIVKHFTTGFAKKDRLNITEEEILAYAFRYALGRMTYAVGTVAGKLILEKDNLSKKFKSLTVKEIKEAIEKNNAGMQCDVETWEEVIKHFEE